MAHAGTDQAPPRRKRKPASPGIVARLNQPQHDTPPAEPVPTYGPGRASTPTSTLDQVLSYGAGPLNLPAGKIALPQLSHRAPLPTPYTPSLPRTDEEYHPATPQEIAHAQAVIDASDQQNQHQPHLVRIALHKRAVLDNLLPLAAVGPIGRGPLGELLGSINSLPARERDQVFANLSRADPGIQQAVNAVETITEPHGFIEKVGHNLLPDMLRTPQGIFLGAYELARAGAQALPSASIGPSGVQVHSGDTTALQQAGNATIEPLLHPGSFVQDHPFQALISFSGVGRAAGAAAGTAGRAGAFGAAAKEALSGNAPREVVSPAEVAIAGTDSTPIFRTLQDGTYDRNATVQLVQRLKDAAAARSDWLFSHRVKVQGDQSLRLRQALRNQNTRERINPVAEASRQASPEERAAAIYAGGPSGQGLRPSDLIAHYQDRVDSLQRLLLHATGRDRGQMKRDIHYAQGALDSWREIYAKVGDDITPHMAALQQAVRDAVAHREQELADLGLLDPDQMALARQQPQDIILNPHEARVADPFYVPHRPIQRGRERVLPKRSTSILAAREGTIHGRTGHLLDTGNLDLSMRPVVERLAQPGDAAAAAHFLNDLRAKHGVHVSTGDTFDPSHEQLVSATTNADAAMTDGYDVLRANIPQQHSTGVVPDGDWMLVPKRLWDERVGHFAPREQTAFDRFGHNLTNAFRWYALSARPAWLVSNIVGNTAQAVLGGVGPVSAIRALDKTKGIGKRIGGQDYTGVIPATVPYGGLLTQMLAPKRGLLPRSDRLPQNPLRLANVTTENWARRALYLRHAIPEYGRDIDALTAAKTAEERAPRVVKIVDRFLGQFGHGKGRYVAAVPFLGWLTFITKHTLLDLPIHHPARALLLSRLGELGNAASAYEGLLNQSLQGAIPAGEGDQGPVGPTTNFIRTGSLNPWATVSQLGSFDPREPTGQPNFAGAVGAINPFGQILYGAATGHELDNPNFTGPSTLNPQDRAAYIFGQLLGTVPFTRLVDPNLRIGQPPASEPRQPQPSFLQRLLGYNLIGVSPVDTQLMNIKNTRGLIQNLRDQARR